MVRLRFDLVVLAPNIPGTFISAARRPASHHGMPTTEVPTINADLLEFIQS